jgi:NAD(P)-dependent dehydrogenase (short-subunit alcohol dehydrogenase family)
MVELDKPAYSPGKILITGGTSGLGLELVRLFLQIGYDVVATGRNEVSFPEYHHRFTFIMTDFSDLHHTSSALKRICETRRFDIVVNNAGILSPPDFTLTDDGLEYTFQVNFLSHLLVNEIVLKNTEPDKSILFGIIVSPVYRIAEKDLRIQTSDEGYKALRAYSNSKFYLTLMCAYLPLKYPALNVTCIGFDPGVFSSNIFRMQKNWFRILYRVAAPFMSKPGKIARRFIKIIRNKDLINGAIYKSGKGTGIIPVTEVHDAEIFWHECYKKIESYMN